MVGRIVRLRRLLRDLWKQIDQWAASSDPIQQEAALALLNIMGKHRLLHPKPVGHVSAMVRDKLVQQPEPLPPTEGQNRLLALLAGGSDVRAIAEACGVPQPVVLAWANRTELPDPVSRVVLDRDFGVPSATWQ